MTRSTSGASDLVAVRVAATAITMTAAAVIAAPAQRQNWPERNGRSSPRRLLTLFETARPTADETLERALTEAERTPELAPLVEALHRVPEPAGS